MYEQFNVIGASLVRRNVLAICAQTGNEITRGPP